MEKEYVIYVEDGVDNTGFVMNFDCVAGIVNFNTTRILGRALRLPMERANALFDKIDTERRPVGIRMFEW